MASTHSPCPHTVLQLEPSPWAHEAGFEWKVPDERLAATTRSNRNLLVTEGQNPRAAAKLTRDTATHMSKAFPGPLVLPFDDLNWDPDSPPQSFRSWLDGGYRNKPTKKRRTLYVADIPEMAATMSFMRHWYTPQLKEQPNDADTATTSSSSLSSPPVEDFIRYLGAFYHGFTVKPFPQRLHFVPWSEGKKAPKRPRVAPDSKYVGLATAENATRIRARPSPDGIFKGQLNLDDILDAAISMLPDDAYSIILLVDHDLYESEDDDFCCGRAYGGSRVCVVSTARYHPSLDKDSKIDYQHMWPAAHCKSFADGLCALQGLEASKPKKGAKSDSDYPIRKAVAAAAGLQYPSTAAEHRALWFSRLARTVVHEMGHCMGMGHCVYYACNMQGTAGMAEDLRQPPYLCPVCLAKISHKIACELQGRDEAGRQRYVIERYEALAVLCDEWKDVALFAGYRAWLRARLAELRG
ncbi:hypothetical protein F4778DRAFT_722564 [Xylariomycetidae sp. FL2044]|nr:hypothetical protein F4778DRAFT_722564 [Xylariomycetidae sp. FL2044]